MLTCLVVICQLLTPTPLQIIRITDIPSDKTLRLRYLRARIGENDVHLQVAQELLQCLDEEEHCVRERFNTIQRLDVAASGLVAVATAEATAGTRVADDTGNLTDATDATDGTDSADDDRFDEVHDGGGGDAAHRQRNDGVPVGLVAAGTGSGTGGPQPGHNPGVSAGVVVSSAVPGGRDPVLLAQRSPAPSLRAPRALDEHIRHHQRDPATMGHADELWVQIVGAVGLPITDIISQSTDPFVRVAIDGDPLGHHYRTKHISRTKDPVWGAEFEFHLRDRLSEPADCLMKARAPGTRVCLPRCRTSPFSC